MLSCDAGSRKSAIKEKALKNRGLSFKREVHNLGEDLAQAQPLRKSSKGIEGCTVKRALSDQLQEINDFEASPKDLSPYQESTLQGRQETKNQQKKQSSCSTLPDSAKKQGSDSHEILQPLPPLVFESGLKQDLAAHSNIISSQKMTPPFIYQGMILENIAGTPHYDNPLVIPNQGMNYSMVVYPPRLALPLPPLAKFRTNLSFTPQTEGKTQSPAGLGGDIAKKSSDTDLHYNPIK